MNERMSDKEFVESRSDRGFERVVGFSPVRLVLGLVGAAAGGAIGFFAFNWGVAQRLVAHVVPGALVGLGFGLASRSHSTAYGVICALLALFLSLYLEWYNFPFIADDSLGYFLSHIHELKPFNLIMMGIGVILAYSYGKGSRR